MDLRKAYQQGKENRERQAEIKRLMELLTDEDMETVISAYEKKTGKKVKTEQNHSDKFAMFIRRKDVQVLCPECKEMNHYAHSNPDSRNIRFYCNTCKKPFSPFKGTLVQGSGLSWEVWIELVRCTLENNSLVAVKHMLEADYNISMTEQTILSYRHKIQKAIVLTFPMPKLSGVVQVDETYFREGQKGSRSLVNVAPTAIEKRVARLHAKSHPSKLGINGPEFSCVVTGIDSIGHIAAVVTGLGKGSSQPFEEYFKDYLGKVDFLCTDGYEAYSRYAEKYSIPHYVQMSEARSVIKKELQDYKDRYKVTTTEQAVRESLYGTRQLDYIDNYGRMSYHQFERLKAEKALSLERIDNYHAELKLRINKELRGVSTVYLPLYIGFRVFIHNWKIDHNNTPLSSKADAEQIFTALLMAGDNFVSRNNLENQSILDFSKPATKYINHLKKSLDEIRQKSKQSGFTFDDNDRLLRFNKRLYFENAPKARLKEICKEYHVKGYTKMTAFQMAREICKLPDVNHIFLCLVAADSVHSRYIDDLTELLKQEESGK